jgi:hypothetical protein
MNKLTGRGTLGVQEAGGQFGAGSGGGPGEEGTPWDVLTLQMGEVRPEGVSTSLRRKPDPSCSLSSGPCSWSKGLHPTSSFFLVSDCRLDKALVLCTVLSRIGFLAL